jgi:hypothetical protein
MPLFDINPLLKLAVQPPPADRILDLGRLGKRTALQQLSRLVSRAEPGAYHVVFQPAAADGRETLFLPVGRWLLQQRQAGRLTRCLPLPQGNGFYIEVADGPQRPPLTVTARRKPRRRASVVPPKG